MPQHLEQHLSLRTYIFLVGGNYFKKKKNSTLKRNSQVKSYCSISIAYSHLVQRALSTAQSLHTSPAELMVDRATAIASRPKFNYIKLGRHAIIHQFVCILCAV